jgi:hypothetical protein
VTPAVLDRPIFLSDPPLQGGRVTLEERLNSVLHSARTNGSAECPLCHARMTPSASGASSAGAAAAASATECTGCGTRLS